MNPKPLTVGAIRAAMDGLPDYAQVFIDVEGMDLPITDAIQSQQIPWSADEPDADNPHAVVLGLELEAKPDSYDPEWVDHVRSKIRLHRERVSS